MEPEFKIYGTASLREDYSNPKDKKYYAVLSLDFKVEGRPITCLSRVENIIINIPEEQYDSLRKKLEESEAEESILKVDGKLELKLGSVCIN